MTTSETERIAHSAIGIQVRAARMQQRSSLRSVARALRISPATLSHIETGKARLSVVRLAEIATVLGTTPAAILGNAPTKSTGSFASTVSDPVSHDDWRKFAPLELDPVLSAALDEFLRVGYHGATVRDIARRAGLSVSGVYHYHASKQAILHALLRRTMNDLLWRTRAARAEGRDSVERFTLVIECLVLFNTHHRQLAFVGLSEMRSLESANFQEIVALRKAQQKMVDEEVAAAVSAGRFTTGTPHEAAIAVAAMCLSVSQWYNPNESPAPEQIAANYIRFALDLMRVVDVTAYQR